MKKIISIIKNKYLLTIIGLGVWISFFDKNDLPTQNDLHQQVKALQEEHDYYSNEIKSITINLRELSTNTKTLEKFAREKYYMKRDNEEIFVLVEKK